jgi:hypothetical protein
MKNILAGYLRKFIDSPKASVEAHTFFAEFLFKEIQNVFSAHYQLNQAKSDAMPVSLRFKQYFLRKTIKHEVNPNEVGNKRFNFIEKVIKTEKVMQVIKSDMKEVLKLSLSFWRDFSNYNNADFFSFKKELEVCSCQLDYHQPEVPD